MASVATGGLEGTPLPVIGKAGRYTVFITPPATPKTPSGSRRSQGPCSEFIPDPNSDPSPKNETAADPPPPATKASPSPPPPPPVQVPPLQFGKPSSRPSNSVLGFFSDAVGKVQDAHSSLDECLADWFGLNQSKYQWALDDYHEKKGMDKEAVQTKDPGSKIQNV